MFDHYTEKKSYTGFGERRLEKRYEKIKDLLESGQSSIINKISSSRSERKGSYDFFRNAKVEESAIKLDIYDQLERKVQSCESLVVFQDTSEYNYYWYKDRIRDKRGLGSLSGSEGLGYFTHPSIVLDAEEGHILGLSDLQLWHRAEDCRGTTNRSQRAFEAKESYKWWVGISNSHQRLSLAKCVTYVQDREGDVFESIVRVKDLERAELLVRSRSNRKIITAKGDQSMLYEHLEQQPVAFTYELEIQSDKRKNRKKRVAQMEVRTARVALVRPANLDTSLAEKVQVDVVWTREKPSSVPKGEQAVDWKLITTHQVHEQQKKIVVLINWYVQRWKAEEFFFVTKTGAYNLEKAQLESGKGLRKLALMVMNSSIKIMQLKQARDGDKDLPIRLVFDEQEEEYLERLNPTLEGKTEKLKNPHKKGTLARAAWIIARLGGWKGYQSSRKPGTKTFRRGLDKFNIMKVAWQINPD